MLMIYANFLIYLSFKKKLRRIKAAKDLYRKGDERIIGYEKRQLLKMLANRSYHSPEISESDEENPDKTIVCVYDYSWRSQEVYTSIFIILRYLLYFDIYTSIYHSRSFLYFVFILFILSFLAKKFTSKRHRLTFGRYSNGKITTTSPV
jgi:hypothetical protein